MQRMKKYLAAAMSMVVLLVSLAGCSQGTGAGTAAQQAVEATTQEAAQQAVEATTQEAAQQTEASASAGTVVPADPKVQELLGKMTLREKVAQMFVSSVRTWADTEDAADQASESAASQGTGGTPLQTMLPEVAALIAKERFGGMIFFGENCDGGNEKLLELAYAMQKANQDTDSECVIPLLLAADQEGGIVARLGEGTRGIGNMALSATGKEEYIAQEASIFGRELRDCGVNTTFAPDIDVNNNPNNPVIGIRSFSDDPETVAKSGIVYMNAMGAEGIITSIKHFPGHGDTDTDSHTGLPMVDKSYEELRQCELVPFQAAIDAGAEMIMTAHIQYPQLDPTTVKSASTGEDIYLPATLSRRILTDVLRGDMGFEGVIVSDALNMDAITAHFGKEEACVMAINAGADLLLAPIMIWNAETAQQMGALIDSLTQKVESGEISKARVDDAVTRILNMKAKHNLLDPVDTELTQEEKEAAADPVRLAEDQQIAWDHATEAVTLVKNEENLLPLAVQEEESVLFVYTTASRVYTAQMAMERLKEKGLLPESVTYQSIVVSEDTEQEAVEAVKNADHIVAVSTAFNTGVFNPTADSGVTSRILDEVIAAAHEAGRKVALLSGYLPYDAARYQEADAIVITYDSLGMPEVPTGTKAYIPNLTAGICCAFGEFKPVGTLPVVIPTMDENYTFTRDVLYDRGFSLTYGE